MPKKSYIQKIAAKVGDLPAVPEIVAEVMALTEDPNAGLSSVAETIERDPALTVKLLKISNSPYYGMRQVVGSLKLALVILGIREVRNIVLGISVLDAFQDQRAHSSLGQNHFWEHSFKAGALAKRLSDHFELGRQGEDFVSGLLHDIGKLVLWRELEGEYDAVFKESEGRPAALHEVEREAFGFDHAEVGAALAHHWNLPETLVDAIGYHHANQDKLAEATDPQLAATVWLVNAALHDDLNAEDIATLKSCSGDLAWTIIGESPKEPDIEDRRSMLSGFMDEIGQAERVELF